MPSPSQEKSLKISVVIVNYNVKDYLAHALSSLGKALTDIPHEIIIVDNNSIDGSVPYIKKNFPGIRIIENSENLGFGRANNQALRIAVGEYIVLINPDTLVQEDTFTKLLGFFEKTPGAGAATCKIINPDGSFSVDCRHSIPTPTIALWKVMGLSRLFPKNRVFGQYNLTYLDENKVYQVPAISGSFMMIRREVLERVGHFDERFFMYCEDIDLCYRINQNGFKIFYVPTTSIIHYKGESTRKDRLDYVITFNKSLYKFFQKYYAPTSIFLFRWLVAIGIFLRGIFIYIKNFLENHFPLLLDMVILNSIIILSFIIRLEFGRGFYWKDYLEQFWVINAIGTVLFLGIAFYLEIYPNKRFSIQSIVKANILTFILLASLTFFFKQFAFSRMVVLLTFIVSPLLMIGWRTVLRRFYRGDRSALGKDLFAKPTMVIGSGGAVERLFRKLQDFKSIDYDLKGWINVEETKAARENANSKNLGSLRNLQQIIKMYRIRQIIFSADSLSYEQILKIMSTIQGSLVEFKMVPSNLEVVIGKSHIEKLDDYPLLEIGYSLGKKFNQFLKRTMDILFSAVLFLLLNPVALIVYIFRAKKYQKCNLQKRDGSVFSVLIQRNSPEEDIVQFTSYLYQILRGNFSFVGAPFKEECGKTKMSSYYYKPGVTGLVQINRDKISSVEDEEKYHLYYMKNQSTLLDFEILLKALWQQKKRS